MVYQWREGSVFAGKKGVTAQSVGTRIEKLRQATGGELLPKDVVADAKSPKSPLHRLFDWDIRSAATKHWLQTARIIMGSIVVSTNSEPSLTRAFVSVDSASGKGRAYVGLQSALADPRYSNALLSAARADFQTYKDKYNGLRQLESLFEEGERIFSR